MHLSQATHVGSVSPNSLADYLKAHPKNPNDKATTLPHHRTRSSFILLKSNQPYSVSPGGKPIGNYNELTLEWLGCPQSANINLIQFQSPRPTKTQKGSHGNKKPLNPKLQPLGRANDIESFPKILTQNSPGVVCNNKIG